MASFDFLANENVDDDDDDDYDDDGLTNGSEQDARATTAQLIARANRFKVLFAG